MLMLSRYFLLCALIFGISLTSLHAQGEEPLQIVMKAYRLVESANGTTEVETEEAAPGDLILYRATFTNGGSNALEGLRPLIPIPHGMVYVDASASPAPEAVALAGHGFVAYPVSAEGDHQPALESYRAFRWQVAALAPGEAFHAELKVRVPAE